MVQCVVLHARARTYFRTSVLPEVREDVRSYAQYTYTYKRATFEGTFVHTRFYNVTRSRRCRRKGGQSKNPRRNTCSQLLKIHVPGYVIFGQKGRVVYPYSIMHAKQSRYFREYFSKLHDYYTYCTGELLASQKLLSCVMYTQPYLPMNLRRYLRKLNITEQRTFILYTYMYFRKNNALPEILTYCTILYGPTSLENQLEYCITSKIVILKFIMSVCSVHKTTIHMYSLQYVYSCTRSCSSDVLIMQFIMQALRVQYTATLYNKRFFPVQYTNIL